MALRLDKSSISPTRGVQLISLETVHHQPPSQRLWRKARRRFSSESAYWQPPGGSCLSGMCSSVSSGGSYYRIPVGTMNPCPPYGSNGGDHFVGWARLFVPTGTEKRFPPECTGVKTSESGFIRQRYTRDLGCTGYALLARVLFRSSTARAGFA